MASVQLIRQGLETDCGIAVAAMLSNQTYGAALCALQPTKGFGLSVKEMRTLLIRLRRNKKQRYRQLILPPFARVPIHLMPTPGPVSAWLIREKHKRYGHWICIDGNTIYDPDLLEPTPKPSYTKQTWHVLAIIEPE